MQLKGRKEEVLHFGGDLGFEGGVMWIGKRGFIDLVLTRFHFDTMQCSI